MSSTPPPSTGRPPAGHETHEPARLLVVDDLEANRELLARRVRRLGHQAGFAEDGIAALGQLAQGTWDLVLLDITMPGMDGYETLRRIRESRSAAELPVIMVTAIDDTDSVVRCLELGADDYVTKPFNPVLLQARIEAALARKRLADQREATRRALARELEIGRQIQQGFLPQALPVLDGWRFSALCTPARHVGGDFYDAIPLPGGRIGLVIADVCDKGVGAALYMALFRTLLRAMLGQAPAGEPPAAALHRVLGFINDYIAGEHGRDNMFATMFVAIFHPEEGELAVVNAGHDAPIIRRSGGQLERIPPGGPAVGLLPGLRHEVVSVTLQPGDLLLAYTDGVPDATGEHGPFGEAALLDLVAATPADPETLTGSIARQLSLHAGDRPAHDDVTVLCAARTAG